MGGGSLALLGIREKNECSVLNSVKVRVARAAIGDRKSVPKAG